MLWFNTKRWNWNQDCYAIKKQTFSYSNLTFRTNILRSPLDGSSVCIGRSWPFHSTGLGEQIEVSNVIKVFLFSLDFFVMRSGWRSLWLNAGIVGADRYVVWPWSNSLYLWSGPVKEPTHSDISVWFVRRFGAKSMNVSIIRPDGCSQTKEERLFHVNRSPLTRCLPDRWAGVVAHRQATLSQMAAALGYQTSISKTL